LDTETALTALGFDSLALMEMRVLLQKSFGRFLPMGMLAAGASLRSIALFYTGSTIVGTIDRGSPSGTLAVGLTSAPQTRIEAPLPSLRPTNHHNDQDLVVTLRDGVGAVVALVHPVGGDVLCYAELAAAWPGDAKIVGIRHPEAEAGHPLPRSVAQLAELYRRALTSSLGRPPEIVGGWSFGGMVAHEIASQWAETGEQTAVVLIDSPFPDGPRAARTRGLIRSIDHANDANLLAQMIVHPDFPGVFDEQHGLDRLRRLEDSETVDRLFRIHAANAIAIARHTPRPLRGSHWYALALRADNAKSCEEALQRLAALSVSPVSVLGFDCDHFSIMRAPAIFGVAGFLGTAARHIERSLQMVAE
jgi:thioesterase domain-containing protein